MPTRREHFITLDAEGIGELRILKGDGIAKVTDGYGKWEVVDRPRRIGLTLWRGSDPIRMSLPVVFEGWPDRQGQEDRISKLIKMSKPIDDLEPPTLSVEGEGIPRPARRWVIESIDWGDNVIWDTELMSGEGPLVRLRQDCTINLLQYVAEDRAAFSKLGSTKPGGGAWPKHYTWKHGDTLRKVAVKFYHNQNKWRKIAKANGIRDPKNIKVGRVLIIPKP